VPAPVGTTGHEVLLTMVNTFLVLVASIVWLGVEVYRQAHERRRRVEVGSSPAADRGSLVLLDAGIAGGNSIAFAASFSPYGHLPGSPAVWLVLGASLVVAGLLVRHLAMRTLAAWFAYQVRIEPDQPLVSTGLYRRVRHPGYLGQLLVFAGFGVALANGIAIVGMLVPVVIVFGWRIRVEEAEMGRHFGAAYETYRRGTWRLIPGVY
jgi:protein-S-isoprenylcysteine O-methyltransferase Ste14